MWIEEFEVEKAWWVDRQESERAWRFSIEEIKANGYNLDIKNPHAPEDQFEDPAVLLQRYQELAAQAEAARLALKQALMGCLEAEREVG